MWLPIEQGENTGNIFSFPGGKPVNWSGTCNEFEVELKEIKAGPSCILVNVEDSNEVENFENQSFWEI